MTEELLSNLPTTERPNPLTNQREEINKAASQRLDALMDGQISRDEYLQSQIDDQLELIELRNKVYADSLNREIHNKLGFQERLIFCIKEALKTGSWITLTRLDMDNFKRVNSVLGHDGADELLIDLGSILLSSARSRRSDTVAKVKTDTAIDPYKTDPDHPTAARDGGDEYAVILPGTHVLAGKTVVTRSQQAFKQIIQDSYPQLAEVSPGITAGISFVDCSDPAIKKLTPEAIAQKLKKEADKALMLQKERSKGGILIYDQNDPEINNFK